MEWDQENVSFVRAICNPTSSIAQTNYPADIDIILNILYAEETCFSSFLKFVMCVRFITLSTFL